MNHLRPTKSSMLRAKSTLGFDQGGASSGAAPLDENPGKLGITGRAQQEVSVTVTPQLTKSFYWQAFKVPMPPTADSNGAVSPKFAGKARRSTTSINNALVQKHASDASGANHTPTGHSGVGTRLEPNAHDKLNSALNKIHIELGLQKGMQTSRGSACQDDKRRGETSATAGACQRLASRRSSGQALISKFGCQLQARANGAASAKGDAGAATTA